MSEDELTDAELLAHAQYEPAEDIETIPGFGNQALGGIL